MLNYYIGLGITQPNVIFRDRYFSFVFGSTCTNKSWLHVAVNVRACAVVFVGDAVGVNKLTHTNTYMFYIARVKHLNALYLLVSVLICSHYSCSLYPSLCSPVFLHQFHTQHTSIDQIIGNCLKNESQHFYFSWTSFFLSSLFWYLSPSLARSLTQARAEGINFFKGMAKSNSAHHRGGCLRSVKTFRVIDACGQFPGQFCN